MAQLYVIAVSHCSNVVVVVAQTSRIFGQFRW